MRVLFLAAEAVPFAKVGGLADVAGELPAALSSLGVEVRTVIPFHREIRDLQPRLERVVRLKIPTSSGTQLAELYEARLDNHKIYLIDGPAIQKATAVYDDPERDTEKFTFAAVAAMQCMQALDWRPDILHAHDWHASAAVVWLKYQRKRDEFWGRVSSLLTVHNLPYMGASARNVFDEYGLRMINDPLIPEWARDLPFPMGLSCADRISAVSPSYTREIQTPEFGSGLENLMRSRWQRLHGILNGIDVERWNPETDSTLPHTFGRKSLSFRKALKEHVQKKLKLPLDAHIPLISMVTRLDHQKGIDIGLAAMEKLEGPWQFVLLGAGNNELEAAAHQFSQRFKNRSSITLRFDTRLARLIFAGADMIMMPSRYEPCGLTQMIAMRYGCVPIAAATGGLRDTVMDIDQHKSGTGFTFEPAEVGPLKTALLRAISVYRDPRRWRGIQLRGMARDFSWETSALEYYKLYEISRAEVRSH
ncbi:MAG: glycogen synthase [Chloroflexi bacterium]|nr:glycogen synthase [Chloroflexota bacterium]